MKPRCHNRAPWSDLRHPGDADRGIPPSVWPHVMSQDCGSWKTSEGLDLPIPVREGWDCSGCRWKPEGGNAD